MTDYEKARDEAADAYATQDVTDDTWSDRHFKAGADFAKDYFSAQSGVWFDETEVINNSIAHTLRKSPAWDYSLMDAKLQFDKLAPIIGALKTDRDDQLKSVRDVFRKLREAEDEITQLKEKLAESEKNRLCFVDTIGRIHWDKLQLLDKIAEKDARIAELEESLKDACAGREHWRKTQLENKRLRGALEDTINQIMSTRDYLANRENSDTNTTVFNALAMITSGARRALAGEGNEGEV